MSLNAAIAAMETLKLSLMAESIREQNRLEINELKVKYPRLKDYWIGGD